MASPPVCAPLAESRRARVRRLVRMHLLLAAALLGNLPFFQNNNLICAYDSGKAIPFCCRDSEKMGYIGEKCS